MKAITPALQVLYTDRSPIAIRPPSDAIVTMRPALSAHLRQGGVRRIEDTGKVHRDDCVHVNLAARGEGTVCAEAACVVDEHVQAAGPFGERVHRDMDSGPVRNVRCVRRGLASRRSCHGGAAKA